MTRMLRPGVALVAALMLLLIVATLALAEQSLLGGKLRTGDTVTVASSETVNGDLYAFAGTVTMAGTIDGDLVALGGQIEVSGSVTGDLIAAGGTISVTGSVDGDARTAGGQVTVSGPVGEDLVIAGGQTTLASGGTVGGDLVISGGNVSVAGSVTGNVEASAGTYARSGTVGGTEHVVQSSQGGVQEPEPSSKVLDAIRHFIVLLLLGALILWLMPRVLRTSAETLRRQPLLALGAGVLTVLAWIVFFIAVVLLMILLAILFGLLQMGALVAIELIAGLLSITVVSFLFVLAIAFVADLVVGLALGRLVASDPPASRWQELLILAAGAAVVVIVTSLPIIGGLAKLLVILFGLGALGLVAWRGWRSRGQQAPPPAAPSAPEAPEAPSAPAFI